jgi:hypothetical protein
MFHRLFYVIQIVPCKRLRLSVKFSSDLRIFLFSVCFSICSAKKRLSIWIQHISLNYMYTVLLCVSFTLSYGANNSAKMRHLEDWETEYMFLLWWFSFNLQKIDDQTVSGNRSDWYASGLPLISGDNTSNRDMFGVKCSVFYYVGWGGGGVGRFWW